MKRMHIYHGDTARRPALTNAEVFLHAASKQAWKEGTESEYIENGTMSHSLQFSSVQAANSANMAETAKKANLLPLNCTLSSSLQRTECVCVCVCVCVYRYCCSYSQIKSDY